jgi:glycosyltransferase involved in cell wall biosynthesis
MKLVVIGDGQLRSELEELGRSLKLAGDVIFLGNREDVAELLNDVDLVALTSKNEGTPLSLIEAMAARKAVVSTAVGGVVDLLGRAQDVHDGFEVCERGLAVTSRRPEDMGSALIYAAQNEKLRESIGEAAREFVLDNYSVERLEEDITRLYEKLLAERDRSRVEIHA